MGKCIEKKEVKDLSFSAISFQKFRFSRMKIRNYEYGAKIYAIFGGSYSKDSHKIRFKNDFNIINYFSFGGFHKFNFYRNLGFRNELLISRFESVIDIKTEGLAEVYLKNKNTSYVLDIPLLLVYRLPLKKQKILLNVGIVPTLTLVQKSSTENIESNEIIKINEYLKKSLFKFKTQFGIDYEYNRFIIGLDIYEDFLGISSSSKFQFGIGLSLGLKLRYRRTRYFGNSNKDKNIAIRN